VERLVLTDVERCREPPSKIVFSAKESVFKCLSPRTGWLLEPADVEVELDLAGGRFAAVVDDRFTAVDVPDQLHGRFAVAHGLIIAATCTPA
jgi:4'-phosphopantetheinyl transferase EntD